MESCKISKSQYYKWGVLNEETFMRHIKSRVENGLYNYQDFNISIISVTPQINDTAMMYRCIEEFPDFDIPNFFTLKVINCVIIIIWIWKMSKNLLCPIL